MSIYVCWVKSVKSAEIGRLLHYYEVYSTLDVFLLFFKIFRTTFSHSHFRRGFKNAENCWKFVKKPTIFWRIYGRFSLQKSNFWPKIEQDLLKKWVGFNKDRLKMTKMTSRLCRSRDVFLKCPLMGGPKICLTNCTIM